MPNNQSPKRWGKQTKFAVVLETNALNEQELSSYCREKGLFPSQVLEWRDACLNGIATPLRDPKVSRIEVRELNKSQKALEREIRRKDKRISGSGGAVGAGKKVPTALGGRRMMTELEVRNQAGETASKPSN